MTPSLTLASNAFLSRFTKLQKELDQTLGNRELTPETKLHIHDRLILRLEGWTDSIADLHILPTFDLELFRQTLETNRKIYRLKVLKFHNIEISEEESIAVTKNVQLIADRIKLANQFKSQSPQSADHLH